MATLRVLVFGSTGVGKTSLCNTLTGHQMPTSDSAQGVTFQSYEFPAFQHDGHSVVLTDTIGLNESDKGRINSTEAVEKLVELINRSATGYNLLIHVMQAPRITQSHRDNYKFFVEVLTKLTVPCLLIATGCENSNPLSNWANGNKAVFASQGFEYKDVIATCFKTDSDRPELETVYAPLRSESAEAVLAAIVTYANPNATQLYVGERGFLIVFKRAWNWLCQLAGKPEMQVAIDKGMMAMLTQIGIPEPAARILATGVNIGIKRLAANED